MISLDRRGNENHAERQGTPIQEEQVGQRDKRVGNRVLLFLASNNVCLVCSWPVDLDHCGTSAHVPVHPHRREQPRRRQRPSHFRHFISHIPHLLSGNFCC